MTQQANASFPARLASAASAGGSTTVIKAAGVGEGLSVLWGTTLHSERQLVCVPACMTASSTPPHDPCFPAARHALQPSRAPATAATGEADQLACKLQAAVTHQRVLLKLHCCHGACCNRGGSYYRYGGYQVGAAASGVTSKDSSHT